MRFDSLLDPSPNKNSCHNSGAAIAGWLIKTKALPFAVAKVTMCCIFAETNCVPFVVKFKGVEIDQVIALLHHNRCSLVRA